MSPRRHETPDMANQPGALEPLMEAVRWQLAKPHLRSLEFTPSQLEPSASFLRYTYDQLHGTGMIEGLVAVPRPLSLATALTSEDDLRPDIDFSYTSVDEQHRGLTMTSTPFEHTSVDDTTRYIHDLLTTWQMLRGRVTQRQEPASLPDQPQLKADFHEPTIEPLPSLDIPDQLSTTTPEHRSQSTHDVLDRIGGLDHAKQALMDSSFGFNRDYIKHFGYQAQPLLLHGHSGSGKSALLEAFRETHHARSMVIAGTEVGSSLVERAIEHLSTDLDGIRNQQQQLDDDRSSIVVFDNIDTLFSRLHNTDERVLLARHLHTKLQHLAALRRPTIVVATAQSVEALPDELFDGAQGFTRCDIPRPGAEERLKIWGALIWSQSVDALQHLAHDTLDDFIVAANEIHPRHQRFGELDLHQLAEESDTLNGGDIARALNSAKIETFVVHSALDTRYYPPISQESLLRAIKYTKQRRT